MWKRDFEIESYSASGVRLPRTKTRPTKAIRKLLLQIMAHIADDGPPMSKITPNHNTLPVHLQIIKSNFK